MQPRLLTSVRFPDGKDLKFEAAVHISNSRNDRHIEQAFYDDWSNGGFDGQHLELEIIEPELWKQRNAQQFHFHTSVKTNEPFVCWIHQIHDESHAEKLFDCWALATAYRMLKGEECPPMHDGKFEEYVKLMSSEHKLNIVRT